MKWCFILLMASVCYAQTIQEQLNTKRVVELEAKTYVLDEPLILDSNMDLIGKGSNTILTVKEPHTEVIIVRKSGKYLYRTNIKNLTAKGSVLWEENSQTCSMENVWVIGSKGDGLVLKGHGEGIKLDTIYCWDNAGHGVLIEPTEVFNHITLNKINSQNNNGIGIVFSAKEKSALVFNTLLSDCIIQGNKGTSQILFIGSIERSIMDHVWVEGNSKYLYRSEEFSSKRPKNNAIKNNSVFAHIWDTKQSANLPVDRVAISLKSSLNPYIESAMIFPSTGRLEWNCDPLTKTNWWAGQKPVGEMRGLYDSQIVATPSIR